MEEEYVVISAQNMHGDKHQNNYCDTFDEAYTLALYLEKDWPYIEILKGTPGHYEQVWCNWITDRYTGKAHRIWKTV